MTCLRDMDGLLNKPTGQSLRGQGPLFKVTVDILCSERCKTTTKRLKTTLTKWENELLRDKGVLKRNAKNTTKY